MDGLPLDQGWLRRAACAGTDPELFFPVGVKGPALEEQAAAKEICGRCSVTRQCLAYALRSGQRTGVWGGLGEEERSPLHRAKARSGRKTGAQD
ncbi:WhiB family transcriptional regulator [Streptomyces sp. ISL-100]|uniref:WhiB family transcriptional regulator n=1 Tax=Streptomyces sp. ISL-100 TaxID=2819173 RepID=UPI001BE619DD|nr:WhiB family transcriptional regulator [Streptomyces sp. ISL-100]MBT2400486.1 WhiB family transcriptional regulator [Streptomyces sp. ISL-100]